VEAKEVKRIIICNATLMWTNPGSVPREKYILFRVIRERKLEECFINAADYEECGLTETARQLANIINSNAKIKEISFKPEISSYTAYADGLFGRPLIPAEFYVFKPLKRKQRIELSQKLLQVWGIAFSFSHN